MEHPDYISPVIESINAYDPLDLLAKVATLQLYPENADHAIRIELLAHAINCIKFTPNRPMLPRHRLDRILNEPPLGNGYVQTQEDPTPNSFTEAFTFFGGSYIVFPGQVNDPTFILKHLNNAIFTSEKFEPHQQFLHTIYRINRGILELSNIIANRAGLVRNLAPKSASRKINIPPDLELKKSAVKFSLQEFTDILSLVGLGYSDLEMFIQPFGSLDPESYSFQNSPLHSKPIIRLEDEIVVAEPWMLLTSLRHKILVTAKKYNILELLFEEFQSAIVQTVGSALDRFGHSQIPFRFNEITQNIVIRESLWSLDTDKILYAAVIPDNFTDFVGEELFEDHIDPEEGERLDSHITNVEHQIYKEIANLGEVFYLLINAGIGRSRTIGLQLDKLRHEPTVLILTAAEIEILSELYVYDTLLVYKFAKSRDSIRKTTHIFAWSTLDEFEIYRKNDYSYYLTDGPRPKLITVGVGGERELRLEVLQKLDFHAVPWIDPATWIEVANAHHVPSCPIYTPLIFNTNQIEYFIELSPVPFWVIAKIEANQSEEISGAPNPGLFVDLISYWIWQFGEELSICLEKVTENIPYVIRIEFDKNYQWTSDILSSQTSEIPISVTIISEHEILVLINSLIVKMLNTEDNSGEIYLMKFVLEGLSNLLALTGWIKQSDILNELIPQLIAKHSSLPLKKKLLVINPNNIPSLLPGNPFSFRKVQEADRSNLLDEVGIFLQTDLQLKEGVIPKEQHSTVLNKIVEFYFQKLSLLIGGLNSNRLLDFLVSHYEAIISERENKRITIATQLACFSSAQELTQQLVEKLPEIDDAALACRFLIEFIVSQPPQGKNPISLTVYDQMMALASEIISRGNQSDLDRFKLFEFEFRLLGSGRLGFNRSQYNATIASYQNLRSSSEVFDASNYVSRLWRERTKVDPNDFPQHVKELNFAFEQEFGIVFTDVSRFIAELGDLSMRMDGSQLKRMEVNTLISEMTAILKWEPEQVLSITNFLTLSPRENFLIPPNPFKTTDVYPWRMSRGLSYMRRPLLIMLRENTTLVCWGVRHLFASFTYLLDATVSGRLQDEYRSKEMRAFLGKIHSSQGEDFNNKVYQAICDIPDLIAYKKVRKVSGKRIGAPGNDLGDIDVLAFFPKKRILVAIECKDLEIARNAIEMSREMEALFIGNEHKKSLITKHMKRVEWVRSNQALFRNLFRINDIKKWIVEPLIVVSNEMITPHFYKPSIPVISYNKFVSEYLPQHI